MGSHTKIRSSERIFVSDRCGHCSMRIFANLVAQKLLPRRAAHLHRYRSGFGVEDCYFDWHLYPHRKYPLFWILEKRPHVLFIFC